MPLDGIEATRVAYFFRTVAKPRAAEFLDTPHDVRRGRLAAIVLYHTVDYWALDTGKKAYDFSKELCDKYRDFLLIRDVANASKHDRLVRKSEPPRQHSDSRQMARFLGIYDVLFGGTSNSHLFVIMDDESKRSLVAIVNSVLSMWESIIS